MKWASIIGTMVGAAIVAAASVSGRAPSPDLRPARAGEATAEITQQQWADVVARLQLLDERTARIESILMENRR
jgi:hypothetical protein